MDQYRIRMRCTTCGRDMPLTVETLNQNYELRLYPKVHFTDGRECCGTACILWDTGPGTRSHAMVLSSNFLRRLCLSYSPHTVAENEIYNDLRRYHARRNEAPEGHPILFSSYPDVVQALLRYGAWLVGPQADPEPKEPHPTGPAWKGWFDLVVEPPDAPGVRELLKRWPAPKFVDGVTHTYEERECLWRVHFSPLSEWLFDTARITGKTNATGKSTVWVYRYRTDTGDALWAKCRFGLDPNPHVKRRRP